ncbi:GNAT family N-acetyltransferase [Streptomyces sp. TRM64462]|uniref:GNAT family N-acetyltransferase n=1 Tax=Streptomyces sp. TRM64462 TaxID=2741726 RepID=UPI0015861697|nr:GNAT family N-acetyltransferase [Streptomyces sp. TRM64462]
MAGTAAGESGTGGAADAGAAAATGAADVTCAAAGVRVAGATGAAAGAGARAAAAARGGAGRLPVRRLGREELADCLRLARGRGWPAELRAWDLLFATGAVYGTAADDRGSGGNGNGNGNGSGGGSGSGGGRGLAGAVGVVRYGSAVTTIGGMLVAERYAGQGLGTRLLRHALDRAPADTLWLTATGQGRPLYERFGFRDIGTLVRCSGTPRPPASSRTSRTSRTGEASRAAGPADLPGIAALDGEVFGADRSVLLRHLAAVAAQVRVVDGPRGPRGYAMAWDAVGTTAIGPVVADGPDTAVALLAGLAARIEGPVRFDVGADRGEVLAWARDRGLGRAVSTTVMVHGRPLPGDRSRLFTPATGALG